MNILYCGDDQVKDGLLISILSLLKNVTVPLHIYVLTATITTIEKQYQPMSAATIQVIADLLQRQDPRNQITRIDVTELLKQDMPTQNLATSFTPGCMLRLFADEVAELPAKILYLDTDVICRQDFTRFYNQDMAELELSGVLDHYGKWFFHQQLDKLDYLNSGVLLLNLEKIRQTALFVKCRQLCQTKKMFMPDQTALNKFVQFRQIAPRQFNEQRRLQRNTVFQHFTTSFRLFPWIHTLTVKPWQVERMHRELKLHEYDDILNEYRQLIPRL
ncbi:glycosyltransferase family 8 protein [Loigolactobacillus zhaoyuanensis]|uniref:glycosyltransferase family 8 protein n=1 Tax=Loigolactobacillus zhaoyuanensis TaxID=2486017 RepID=UPI000F74B6B8|nr:glycosyltransferase [Loigolactobacillus zhaoyuanensis]